MEWNGIGIGVTKTGAILMMQNTIQNFWCRQVSGKGVTMLPRILPRSDAGDGR